MEIIFTLIVLLVSTVVAFGQQKNEKPQEEKEKRPVKVSLLSNYYEQDGDRSAVNGGWGSQKLTSFTQEAGFYIPVKDSSGYKLHVGIDHFTAASLRMIDKYQGPVASGASTTIVAGQGSSVSEDETRYFGSIGYDFANKKKHSIFTPTIGFSKEYDVASINGGLSFAKYFPKKDIHYVTALNIIRDRWMVIYPGEFRPITVTDGGVDGGTGGSSYNGSGSGSGSGSGYYGSGTDYYNQIFTDANNRRYPEPTGKTVEKNGKKFPVDYRTSYSFSNMVAFTINKRMNAAVGLDLVLQKGLLSTPFHRVYFNDGVHVDSLKEVRIEKLPRERFKVSVSGRFNYFLTNKLALRSQVRLYADSWDILAFTGTIEAPYKVFKSLTVTPFYRFHKQQGTSYYNGYGRHESSPEAIPAGYYTSDIDLAYITSNKIGAALRFVPFNAFGISDEDDTKKILNVKSIGLRYAYYKRSDGLKANTVSFELAFEL